MKMSNIKNIKIDPISGQYDLTRKVPRAFHKMEFIGIVEIDEDFVDRLHAISGEVYGSTEHTHMLFEVNKLHDIFHLPKGFLLLLPVLASYHRINEQAKSSEKTPKSKSPKGSASNESNNKSKKSQIKFGNGRVTISSKRIMR